MVSTQTLRLYNEVFIQVVSHLNRVTDGRFHLAYLNIFYSSGYPAATLRPALAFWVDRGYLQHVVEPATGAKFFPDTEKEFWELTGEGLSYSLYLSEQRPAQTSIPASDRFVNLNENHDPEKLEEDFEKLEERVETSNEFTADQAQRAAILHE